MSSAKDGLLGQCEYIHFYISLSLNGGILDFFSYNSFLNLKSFIYQIKYLKKLMHLYL